jgi:hypothetical protein
MKHLTAILLSAIVLLATPARAQRRVNSTVFHAFPVVGMTFSQIEGDELKGFKKAGLTAGVGAVAAFGGKEQTQLSLEADFAQRGARNTSGDPYSITGFTLNYVDIPLMFHYQDPYGGMNVGLGLCYSRLVQQPHGGHVYYSPTYFVPDSANMVFLKNDLAVVIDMRFTIWRGLKLNMRYQRSIIPIKNDMTFTEFHKANEPGETWSNKCYNSSVAVRLLYVFGDESYKLKKHKRR